MVYDVGNLVIQSCSTSIGLHKIEMREQMWREFAGTSGEESASLVALLYVGGWKMQ